MSEATTPYFRTPAAIAELLGIPESTLRPLARRHGTYTKVGKRVMFAQQDVDDMIAKIRQSRPKVWHEEGCECDPFA